MRHEPTGGRPSTIARAAAVATLALSLAALVTACGSAEVVTRRSPPPVRIGALYNLTGSQAALDVPSLDGARLAVDRINANGGLMGRRVELLERDGRTDPTEVRRAAESLVAAHVSAIIGLSDTGQVLAAAPVAAAAGIPFVTSGATSPRLPEQVPDWLFLACFGDNAQAAAGAEYAAEALGARTAVVVFDRDMEYTRLLGRYFSQAFRAQGGRVVLERGFEDRGGVLDALAGKEPPRKATDESEDGGEADDGAGEAESGGDGDEEADGGGEAAEGDKEAKSEEERQPTAAERARNLRAAHGADVLFVAAGPEDAPDIVRRLRAAGYTQTIMGGDSFDDRALVKAAAATGGGVYYTTHAAPRLPSANAAVRRFSASYDAAYGRPPQNAFACLGYDAVDLVAAAVAKADSVRPAAVRDALQATRHFVGVSGTLGYTADDRVPRKRVTIVYVGRRAEVVKQFTPHLVPRP
jgi:branched-chain amino acid transport system substrate-binding protein